MEHTFSKGQDLNLYGKNKMKEIKIKFYMFDVNFNKGLEEFDWSKVEYGGLIKALLGQVKMGKKKILKIIVETKSGKILIFNKKGYQGYKRDLKRKNVKWEYKPRKITIIRGKEWMLKPATGKFTKKLIIK